MSRPVTKRDCFGCEQDFYNGKNPYGVQECWSFKDAKLTKRIRIHIDERPPYKQKPEMLPDCRQEKRIVLVKPESLTAQGYWRRP